MMYFSNLAFSETIHDKGVPGLTLIISEAFTFKNDLHADFHAHVR